MAVKKSKKSNKPLKIIRAKNIKVKVRHWTPKKENLIREFSENIGRKNPKTMTQMMLDAGYSESSARQQVAVLESVKPQLREMVLSRLEGLRDKAIDLAEEKIDHARFRDLVDAIDKIIKNTQLLSGGATENLAVYTWARYGDDNSLSSKSVDKGSA